MSTTKLTKNENLDPRLDNELLLRLVVDSELRSEILVNTKASLPSPVSAQNLSFVELIKSSEETPECQNTCFSGFTIVCDQNTGGQCRSTCVVGYTMVCDGNTFRDSPSPPPRSTSPSPLGIYLCGF